MNSENEWKMLAIGTFERHSAFSQKVFCKCKNLLRHWGSFDFKSLGHNHTGSMSNIFFGFFSMEKNAKIVE